MKSFTAQQDSTGAYINICQRRFRRARQLSGREQKQGSEGGLKGAHRAVLRDDIQRRAFWTIETRLAGSLAGETADSRARAKCYRTERAFYGWQAGSIAPPASRLAIKRAGNRPNPLQDKQAHRYRHLLADQREGITRARSTLTLSELDFDTRARGPGVQRNASAGEMSNDFNEKTPVPMPVGSKTATLWIIDLISQHSAAPFGTLFGFSECWALF